MRTVQPQYVLKSLRKEERRPIRYRVLTRRYSNHKALFHKRLSCSSKASIKAFNPPTHLLRSLLALGA